MSTTDPSSITYFAHRSVRQHDGAVMYFSACPRRWWVELHGLPDTIVSLRLRERREGDPSSDYYGWIDAKDPGEYTNVWPSEGQLEMCFPYGSRAETDRGRGRKVNLIVEEVAT